MPAYQPHKPRALNGLSYANVVATLALFIALGGASAFASTQLGKDSVGTRQLKAGAVGTAKIKDGAVSAAKIRDGAITGAKVDAASLGTVPDATHATVAASATSAATAGFATSAGDARTLGGAPAEAFARGNAQILSGRVDLQLTEEQPLLTVPGVGILTAACAPGKGSPVIGFSLDNTSGGTFDLTLDWSGGTDSGRYEPGQKVEVSGAGVLADRIQIATRTSPPTVATLDLSGRSENTPSACAAYVQTIVSG